MNKGDKKAGGGSVRSKTGMGRVVICDERMRTMRYGKSFLENVK